MGERGPGQGVAEGELLGGPLSVGEGAGGGAPAASEWTQQLDLRVSGIEVVTDTVDAESPAEGGVRITVRWPAEAMTARSLQPFRCGQRVRVGARLTRQQA